MAFTAKPFTVDPGDVLITEGERTDSIYFLMKGKLRVLVKNEGRSHIVGHINAGDIFGEMAFIDQKPRSATVIVEEPSEIVEIPKEMFEGTLKKHEDWFQEFIHTLIKRLKEGNKKVLI